jgi:hypothetical protein
MLDPDVRWHGGNPWAAGACHNRTEALQFMRDGFARGGVGELIDVVGAGDKVVVTCVLQQMAASRRPRSRT